ncbi:HAD-IB family hydrolase [Arenicella xantha]|uniref:1-acyl-sn-glycerol-3-phosphate acyltransferase n=1 Tax=Arenicella xantha TaxID=644221 RepID=A0A395JNN1_9GAMM|nr:HAD-IB family hydrolase [Arenicella xantha]RBP49684.1 putative phosphoserine phosphatase/1-acylglycerol-3-phosphate O-acyltransferase [Arenicella xantha]
MDLYSKVIKEVEASPEGPQIGAFFDFDGTVIYGYSATTYLREQIKRGDLAPRQLVELVKVMTEFGLGNMGFSAMMTAASQYLAGINEDDYLDFAERLYTKHIAKLIYPESRALIEAHLRKGHTVALISAATPYQVMPAARELGIENVHCTHLEVVGGKFTGAVLKPTCYGMGKVDAAEKMVEERGIDIHQSYFYSDSDEDIQLLEFVGKPRPLNPNKRLRRIAKGRGWPVQDFNSRGKASVFDYAKTFATQMSMVTSFAAGLPIYALTGSMNKTRNFSTSLFADTACALTGIELDVEGEENAWAHRPCVFVFNHQSQADVIILPTLLRRDLAGVGKKEIGNVPVLGKLMQLGGTVLIDRENSRSAMEAMKPLVDVLQKEGRSVCIAPEGTRSTSTNLGRFKKGAFHLAMQAGVPIVPIVIHNAIDVAPRGQYVFRPATVKVSVLPAVDTSQWKTETMNQHVEQVRDMFLIELDQMRFQPSREESLKAAESASRIRSKARQHALEISEAQALTDKADAAAEAANVAQAKVSARNKSEAAKKQAAAVKRSARSVVKQQKRKLNSQAQAKLTAERKPVVAASKEVSRAESAPRRGRRRSSKKATVPKVSARTLAE